MVQAQENNDSSQVQPTQERRGSKRSAAASHQAAQPTRPVSPQFHTAKRKRTNAMEASNHLFPLTIQLLGHAKYTVDALDL